MAEPSARVWCPRDARCFCGSSNKAAWLTLLCWAVDVLDGGGVSLVGSVTATQDKAHAEQVAKAAKASAAAAKAAAAVDTSACKWWPAFRCIPLPCDTRCLREHALRA
jgi:hypothetical protein